MIIVLSFTEFKYMVCIHVAKKALWFVRFLDEVEYNQKVGTLIVYDS